MMISRKAHCHASPAQAWFISPGHLGRRLHDDDSRRGARSLQRDERRSQRLVPGQGGIAALGQVAVFDQCRDEIEAVASQKWDCSRLQDGKVIVKPEDLVEAGLA
jgi:hypothetical protein